MNFLRGDYLEKKRLRQVNTTCITQRNNLYQSEYINSISSVEKLFEDV
jgi:hypothetical protein